MKSRTKRMLSLFGAAMLAMPLSTQLVHAEDTRTPLVDLNFESDGHGGVGIWMLKGDVNRDWKVNFDDVVMLSRYLVEGIPSDDWQLFEAMDVDGSGTIDRNDFDRLLSCVEVNIIDPECYFTIQGMPDEGYKVSGITVNGVALAMPDSDEAVYTDVEGQTYSVCLDADMNPIIDGPVTFTNDVYFTHTPADIQPIVDLQYSADGNGVLGDWYLKGDINRDWKVTMEDVTALEELIASGITPDLRHYDIADIDYNATIDAEDVATLTQAVESQIQDSFFSLWESPKPGYEVTGITYNGTSLPVPEREKYQTIDMDGTMLFVSVDIYGNVYVNGRTLETNSIHFTHTAVS